MKILKCGSLMAIALIALLCVTGCENDAAVVSRNISNDAENFKVQRRVIFYNSITDTYMLVIEGLCQVEHAQKLAITCKTGANSYKKHYLGLSNNVTYFVEQLEDSDVSAYHYKVIFKPQTLLPDVEMKTGK